MEQSYFFCFILPCWSIKTETFLPDYCDIEKYDLLGEKYQAVAYLLSLSSREVSGSSTLAGGERELNKSLHAGEQKKGTRGTSGEVL